jgi:hypothetical protein
MKKIVILLLALVLCFAVTACSSETPEVEKPTTPSSNNSSIADIMPTKPQRPIEPEPEYTPSTKPTAPQPGEDGPSNDSEAKTYTFNADDVISFDINCYGAQVIIQTTTENTISITTNLPYHDVALYEGYLSCSQQRDPSVADGDTEMIASGSQLIISIPEGKSFDDVNLRNSFDGNYASYSSVNWSVEELNAAKLNIYGDMSDMHIKKLVVTDAFNFYGGMGDMLIEESVVHNAYLKLKSGDTGIVASFTGENIIDCGFGNLTVGIKDAANLAVDISSGTGALTINGYDAPMFSKTDGEHSLKINRTSGNVIIDEM